MILTDFRFSHLISQPSITVLTPDLSLGLGLYPDGSNTLNQQHYYFSALSFVFHCDTSTTGSRFRLQNSTSIYLQGFPDSKKQMVRRETKKGKKAAPDKCHSRRAIKFIQQLSLQQAQTHPSHLISYIKTLREMSGQITAISAQPLTLKDSECADTCTVCILLLQRTDSEKLSLGCLCCWCMSFW